MSRPASAARVSSGWTPSLRRWSVLPRAAGRGPRARPGPALSLDRPARVGPRRLQAPGRHDRDGAQRAGGLQRRNRPARAGLVPRNRAAAVTTRARADARLRVNMIACDGRGLCAEVLPELITLDDWGFPIIADGVAPARLQGQAGEPVPLCPTLALRLEQ